MATQSTSTVPHEINNFFEKIYGCEPQVSKIKKDTKYSVPGAGISISTDTYGGCHIDVTEIPSERILVAQKAIEQLSEIFKTNKAFDSIYINFAFPVNANILGAITPDSFKIGVPEKSDLIYDYQQKKVRIWQWLNPDKECTIPPGATHNIGATALMLDMVAKKVLLVVNVRRSDSWNLPGGSYDPLKDSSPCYTALRKAQEEGGFKILEGVALQSKLMGQIQFPKNQFAPAINQIWAYFIDGISQTTLNPPANEIKQAKWVDFVDVCESKGTLDGFELSGEIKISLRAAIQGLGFQEFINKGRMIVKL